MDWLELHLKLDKIDPAMMPESQVKHKTEIYGKMASDWTEVDNKGKQLITDAADVSRSSHALCHSLQLSLSGFLVFKINICRHIVTSILVQRLT